MPDQGSMTMSEHTGRRRPRAALPYADIPKLVVDLKRASTAEPIKAAIEFLILTAARTDHVIRARWEEFDVGIAAWTIPAERMRTNHAHQVPLAPRAVAILREMHELLGAAGFVFHLGREEQPQQPLSNMSLLMPLRRMGYACTVQGFRTTFSEWAAEQANFPPEIAEAALGRPAENSTGKAEHRRDLVENRRQLMLMWEKHVLSRFAKVAFLRSGSIGRPTHGC